MMVCAFPMSIIFLLSGGTYSEFAEYTSAQERIALGKKSPKAEAKKRREEIESLIADTYGNPPIAFILLTPSLRLEDDEEEKEWEQEQIRRAGNHENAFKIETSEPEVYKPSPST